MILFQKIDEILNLASNMTIYASEKDRALQVSNGSKTEAMPGWGKRRRIFGFWDVAPG